MTRRTDPMTTEYEERDAQIWAETPPQDGADAYARENDPFYDGVSVIPTEAPRTDPRTCAHPVIETWRYVDGPESVHGEVAMWACRDCRTRFSPGKQHPIPLPQPSMLGLSAAPASPDVVKRLARALHGLGVEVRDRVIRDDVTEPTAAQRRLAAELAAALPAAAPAPLERKHRPAIGLSSAGRHTLCMEDGEPWPCRTVAAATPPTDEQGTWNDHDAGRVVRCPGCGRITSVPEWCKRPVCVHAWEGNTPEVWDDAADPMIASPEPSWRQPSERWSYMVPAVTPPTDEEREEA